MTTGEKIRTLRKSLKLTQTELGKKLGVQTNAVSKWECGRVYDIPTSKIKAMAQLFDVPASYLLDDDADDSKEYWKRAIQLSPGSYTHSEGWRGKLIDFVIVDASGRDYMFDRGYASREEIDKLWALLKVASKVPTEHLDMARIMLESIPKENAEEHIRTTD